MKITAWFKKKQKQKDKPKVVWLEEADSTNDEIRKLADEQTQRMVVVVTELAFQCDGPSVDGSFALSVLAFYGRCACVERGVRPLYK